MQFVEIPSIHTLVIIKSDNTKVSYVLFEHKENVTEQQFNLPEGRMIIYADGSKLLHCGDYALMRNWRLPDGRVVDRCALRWENLHL